MNVALEEYVPALTVVLAFSLALGGSFVCATGAC